MSVRMSRHVSPLPLATLMLVWLGCASGDDSATTGSSLAEERETVDDTTIVRVISGSEWGAPATLVEDLAIGSLEGAEEDIFGQVLAIAPDLEGGAYVFDYQVPALRHYDATGRYLRTIGAEGEGPGEYGEFILGLEVLGDGRLLLRDGRGNRINIYEADGTFIESWPTQAPFFSNRSTVVDSLEHVFVKLPVEPPRPGEQLKIGLVHMDSEGETLDTLPPPEYEGEPTATPNGIFLPRKLWEFDRWRRIVIGVSDRYEFEIRAPDGRVTRVLKTDWTPVALAQQERDEYQAMLDWQEERLRAASATNPGRFPDIDWAAVPEHKPAYRAFYIGEGGNIWALLHARAEKSDDLPEPRDENQPPPITWREPPVYDVYRGDGTYLGRVEPPPRTRPYTFSLDTLWGVRTGDFDEQYVVRLRLVEPDDDAEATAVAPGSR